MFDAIRKRLARKFSVGEQIEIGDERFEIVQITKRGLALRVKQQQQHHHHDNSNRHNEPEPNHTARG